MPSPHSQANQATAGTLYSGRVSSPQSQEVERTFFFVGWKPNVYVCICVYMYICMCMCVYVYVCVCVYVCMPLTTQHTHISWPLTNHSVLCVCMSLTHNNTTHICWPLPNHSAVSHNHHFPTAHHSLSPSPVSASVFAKYKSLAEADTKAIEASPTQMREQLSFEFWKQESLSFVTTTKQNKTKQNKKKERKDYSRGKDLFGFLFWKIQTSRSWGFGVCVVINKKRWMKQISLLSLPDWLA